MPVRPVNSAARPRISARTAAPMVFPSIRAAGIWRLFGFRAAGAGGRSGLLPGGGTGRRFFLLLPVYLAGIIGGVPPRPLEHERARGHLLSHPGAAGWAFPERRIVDPLEALAYCAALAAPVL